MKKALFIFLAVAYVAGVAVTRFYGSWRKALLWPLAAVGVKL